MEATKQRTKVADEAAHWWVVMQDNPSTAARAAYADWLRESSAHVVEMLRLYQLHAELERFRGWADTPTKNAYNHDALIVDLLTRWPTNAKRARTLTPASISQKRKVLWIGGTLILAILIALVHWA